MSTKFANLKSAAPGIVKSLVISVAVITVASYIGEKAGRNLATR